MGILSQLKWYNVLQYEVQDKAMSCWNYASASRATKTNYFASSDPHHDISKQLVDTTFVWSFCHGTFAQLTIPIICFTWQVIVHVSLSNRI